jgi:hypothetical protein
MCFTLQSATQQFLSNGILLAETSTYTIIRIIHIYVLFKLTAHMIIITPLY